MPKRQPDDPIAKPWKYVVIDEWGCAKASEGRQFKPRPVRWRQLQRVKGRQTMTDYYLADMGKVKSVRVVERGFYGRLKELTPGVSLLVRTLDNRTIRADQAHLYVNREDAERAVAEGRWHHNWDWEQRAEDRKHAQRKRAAKARKAEAQAPQAVAND